MRTMAMAVVAVGVLGAAAPAGAEPRHRDRLEVTWGFLGGKRSYAHQSFAFDEGDASPALAAPFVGEPFDGVRVLGLGFEVRASINGVRAGIGGDWPYPEIAPDIMLATAGGPPARVRALETEELRLSVGYELMFGKTTAYVDVVGTAYQASAKVVVGDAQSTYSTEGFGFSTRAGVQYPIAKHYFAYTHGEVGLTEHVLWAMHLGLGFDLGE
jgi:hypothetical protein